MNSAGTDSCGACGCPAVIAPIHLQPPEKRDDPQHFLREPGIWATFMPEMAIGGAFVVAAPIWAIVLLVKGHVGFAVFLLMGVGGIGYATYRFIRANEKWASYVCLLGVILVGLIVASHT